MTTEEKARKYDEALERAKKQRADYQKELDKTDKNSQLAELLRAGISAIDMAFPELAESEDENLKNKSGYYKAGKFWKASTLWKAVKDKTPQKVPNRYIMQECTWNISTLQNFADEVKNVQEVELAYPIILDINGNILDGAHRVVKAYLEGKDINIVYLGDDEWPEPDYDEEKVVKESEDERIRKALIWHLKADVDFVSNGVTKAECISYLEKQKENIEKEYVFRPFAGTDITIAAEQAIRRANEGDRLVLAFNGAYIPVRKDSNAKEIVDIYDAFIEKQKDASKAIEAVERIDKYIDEHLANAHDMKDSNPDKKYYRGWDDALGEMAGILQEVYSNEKQKESHYTKRNALFEKCVENCDPKTVEEVNKRVDDIMNMPELSAFEQALTNFIGYWEDDEEHWPSQFVKKHGKHILNMAREELQKENPEEPKIAFGDWGDKEKKEAIITCLKYMRFIKKITNQEYDDLVKWLEDNLKEQKPAEWSEEDERMRSRCIRSVECSKQFADSETYKEAKDKEIDWLKSLRPQSKQEWDTHDKAIVNCIVCCLDGQFVPEAARKQSLEWFNKHRRDFLNSPSWKPSEEKKKETLDGADIGYGLETAIDILENGFMHYQTDDGEYERKQALDVLIFLLNETRKKEDAKLWSKDIVESIVTWATEKLQLYSMKESTPYVEAVKNNAQKVLDWSKEQWPIYYGWKPSEEQMNRLLSIIAALRKDYCDDMANFLASIYHNLEKLM